MTNSDDKIAWWDTVWYSYLWIVIKVFLFMVFYVAAGVGVVYLMHLGRHCGGYLPDGEFRSTFGGGMTNRQPDCPSPLQVDALVVAWPFVVMIYAIKFGGSVIYHILQSVGHWIISFTGGKAR